MEIVKRIHHWLMSHSEHNQLRPIKLIQNTVILAACIFIFFTIFNLAPELNSTPILFLRLGGLLLCIILIVSLKFAKGVFIGLKYGYRGSSNFIKILILLFILAIAVTAYNNQAKIKNFIAEKNQKDIIDRINPIYLSTNSSNPQEISVLSSEPENQKGLLEYIGDAKESIDKSIEESNLNSAKESFDYINQLRKQNGSRVILWDDKIYQLALFKLNDMQERNYWDHKDPSGKCVGNYASKFGLNSNSGNYAENLTGGGAGPVEAVDLWMGSKGHRYNLLYPEHQKGAIACDSENCTFIGYTPNGNWVCDTGANGLAFWENQ